MNKDSAYPYIAYTKLKLSDADMLHQAIAFNTQMQQRRSVRYFTNKPIDRQVIENIIAAAGAAPSGANKQPWTFCVIQDPEIKKQIRIAAEEEEKLSYNGRMNDEWLQDLAPLGTDWQKPFLEIAPYLIIVFKKAYDVDATGNKKQNYYVQESVGIACGMLLTAIHNAGLGSLTHTPSPMNFLATLLNRPANEKPFLLVPVGHIAADCIVPDIQRKPLEDITIWY